VADRIVGWASWAPDKVYALDLDAKRWEARQTEGRPRIAASARNGVFGRWRYAPSVNAFVAVAEDLGLLNPHVQSFMDQGQGLFMQWTGDPVRSKQMSLQVLDNLRQQQALSLAFFDIFWLCAVLAVALVLLVLLMKRSVAEKGEHVSAH
jgi:hypothetical protein